MAERPLVSVILTTYNPGLHELMTSVRSILAQTLSNIELIIVDDASEEESKRNVDVVGGGWTHESV